MNNFMYKSSIAVILFASREYDSMNKTITSYYYIVEKDNTLKVDP